MRRIVELYKYMTDKKYSTIAGTLVYFLLMSIAPFLLWLSLVLGNVHLHVERYISQELFKSVSPVLSYMKSSAENAASGAGVILLVTTLYSSTNFFYHLRRSGEIIYGTSRIKGGLKLRLASLSLIFAAFVMIAAIAAIMITGTYFLEKFLPIAFAEIMISIFLTFAAFTVALLLNIFACPYKLKANEAVPGSLLTTALWLIFLIGFSIYLMFANPEQLYGKIASVIIFLLWCYVMMSCFIVGVIYNSSFKTVKQYKKLL